MIACATLSVCNRTPIAPGRTHRIRTSRGRCSRPGWPAPVVLKHPERDRRLAGVAPFKTTRSLERFFLEVIEDTTIASGHAFAKSSDTPSRALIS